MTKKGTERLAVFVLLLASLLMFQVSATYYQKGRYVKDKYDCSDMSEDCEAFFEGIGINTRFVSGECKDRPAAHMWLLLDFGIVNINFESTRLHPMPWVYYKNTYENFDISDGYYENGNKNERITWSEL